MKIIFKLNKCIMCLVLAMAMLICSGSLSRVNAASGAITVTNALTGENVYNGDNLQEALQMASRGCIVSFDRFYTMTSDVIVDCEVMLSNTDRITDWAGYKLLFTGSGAVYVSSRLARKNYSSLYSYSSVKVTEESGGYVYYLEAGIPTFDVKDAVTKVSNGNGLLAARVDESTGVILLDTFVSGFSSDKLINQITIPADEAEKVTVSCENSSSGYIATGMTLTASASNYDYAGMVTKSYKIIVVGDVNGNGQIDSADANLIVCYSNGLMTLGGDALQAADANCDGTVNVADAELLCSKYIRRDSYSSSMA